MVILIDTNLILDCFIARQPFVDNAWEVLRLCSQQKCSGYIAAHSVTNIFYILRKHFPASERKIMLIDLCEIIEIANIQKKQVIDALSNKEFDDLEDRLQVECARLVNADYIVTRNITDFAYSPIPAILPGDWLQKMAN